MKPSIESLENRQLFSSAAYTALIALRASWGQLSRPLPVILTAYNNVVPQIAQRLVALGVPPLSDLPLVNLHVLFNQTLKTLSTDILTEKNLLNEDSIHLAASVALASKHPTNAGVAALVSNAESVLTAQANAGVSVLTYDCNAFLGACNTTLTAITAAHPIDATLGTLTAALKSAISTRVLSIETAMSNIVTTTAPAYIAAVNPTTTPAA